MTTREALIIESMFHIVNKDGERVPFVLNSGQRELDEGYTGRDIVPKSRQRGVSRYVLARFVAKCLYSENETCAVISHEREATERLLMQCRYYVNNLRGGVRPEMQNESAGLLTFPKTNGMIYIGTAGSKRFGRGDTIRNLHCSEYAYWENALDLFTGLAQAVPKSGEVWIESTGNGRGNDYHVKSMMALNGESEYTCHFLPWYTDPDCDTELAFDRAITFLTKLTEKEQELRSSYNISASRLLWRRMKIAELSNDVERFDKEYPTTIHDCFQLASGGIFRHVNFVQTNRWVQLNSVEAKLDEHPNNTLHYVIGADVAGGVGSDRPSGKDFDRSVAEVFCLETGEQVFEYASNQIAPDVFGAYLVTLAKRFNNAYVVVEANNHGAVTLQEVRRSDYPRYLVHSTSSGDMREDPGLLKMGFRTTVRTKPIMIGALNKMLTDRALTVYSPNLDNELSTFVINPETGKMEAAEGCYDDRVMACACAVMGYEFAATRTAPSAPYVKKPPAKSKPAALSADSIFRTFEQRRKRGLPIGSHTMLRSP